MSVLFQVALCYDEDILWKPNPPQLAIKRLGGFAPVCTVGHHDQQIDIAIWPLITSSGGTKKDDAHWFGVFNNALNQVFDIHIHLRLQDTLLRARSSVIHPR